MSDPVPDQSPTTRREFLKASSAVAVGAGVLGSLTPLHGAFAAGDDTIRVGLVGCGQRGTGAAAQALSTQGNVKLVAVGDAFGWQIENCMTSLRSEFANRPERLAVDPDRMFTGLDAYQKVINSGIDLVILATPPGFRPVQFEAAVKAGKHVFMEKPVAVDAPGVRQVLAAAEEAKKKNLGVGVGLQRHHEAGYLETIRRLKDGAVGDIHTGRAYWNWGTLWTRNRKPEMTEMQYQVWNWYYFTWLSGDHIVEQHIHNIDVINWIKGAYPITAQGQGGRQVRTGKEFGQIFDHHSVEFEYADGARMFSQCRQIDQCWGQVSEHVQGSKGRASLESSKHFFEIVGGKDVWKYPGKSPNPYQVEHDDLFASIRSGNPINEAEYSAMSTMTAILGRLATYSGKVVTMDEALASKISLQPKEYNFQTDPPVLPNADGSYPVAVPGMTSVV
ncbi:MAG: Gfo/Idh/MocA family protein [Planctomycetaceae bacterium]